LKIIAVLWHAYAISSPIHNSVRNKYRTNASARYYQQYGADDVCGQFDHSFAGFNQHHHFVE
jgi:hypothetical protein